MKNPVDNVNVYRSICKCEKVINSYNVVNVSISGGKDSDILLALIEYCKQRLTAKINYVFFDTGIEYTATKIHLKELEMKYNITIERRKAFKPVPLAIKHHGAPFLNKRISNYIERLQRHNFEWIDEPFETLYKKYPKCKAALRWWCNDFPDRRYNIEYHSFLKEYMLDYPPTFPISDHCCTYAKKKTGDNYKKETGAELTIMGLRKAEGGARNNINNCWNIEKGVFYPLLWYTQSDIEFASECFNVTHSKCYTEYGLKRTGCAGCPFGQQFENELEIIKEYEPALYVACNNIFAKSYEYTRNYKRYRELIKAGLKY